jgi:hypothetical protein
LGEAHKKISGSYRGSHYSTKLEENRVSNKEAESWILLVRQSDFSTAAMYFERALQKNFNVITVYLDKFNLISLLPSFLSIRIFDKVLRIKTKASINPDLILVIDPVWKRFDFSFFDAPTAYYAIDSHVSFQHHIRDAHIQDYDFVFVAQKDYISKYIEYGCDKVFWLPLACDPEIHKRHNLPMQYDLCFVGGIRSGTKREQDIRSIRKKFNMFVGRKYLHDMARIYSQSKIVFNRSLMGDLNMRVFESLSCGRLLLTDNIENGLKELFTDGKHLVTYDDLKDLVKKARHYLDNTYEREEIASNGQNEAHRKHTYLQRVKYVAETVRMRE